MGRFKDKIFKKIKQGFSNEEVFRKNDISSNKQISVFMIVLSVAVVCCYLFINKPTIFEVLSQNNYIDDKDYFFSSYYNLFIDILILIVPAVACLITKGKLIWFKYVNLLSLCYICFDITNIDLYNINLVVVLPIILSCRYFSKSLTHTTSLTIIILYTGNILIDSANFVSNKQSYINILLNLYDYHVFTYIIIFIFYGICLVLAKKCHQMVIEQNEISAKNTAIETELSFARDIQKAMLPEKSEEFYNNKSFRIYGEMTPAKEVGGDFYDYYYLDDDHIVLTIADVSGKGVPASLYMSMTKILLKTEAKKSLSPEEILTRVNTQLCNDKSENMFITVWLGIYEISTGLLKASNAGHEFPIIKRSGEKYEIYKDKHSFVLGGLSFAKYKEYEISLNKNDIIFLYTDGATEAINKEEKMFGTDGILNTLNSSEERDFESIFKNLENDIREFSKGKPQFDDITILGLEVLK